MVIQEKTPLISPYQQENEIRCRLCGSKAMCNKFICYKKKQGKVNCNSCEERLCQRHWRVFFKNNI
jgi:ribosomal protein S27E